MRAKLIFENWGKLGVCIIGDFIVIGGDDVIGVLRLPSFLKLLFKR